jgi:PAS domain S-box-containing protein
LVREDPSQQHDDQFRSLVESSPDLFFRLSQAGTIVYCSPASQAMFGCGPENDNSHHYLAFVASASQPLAEQAFRLLCAGDRVQEITLGMRRPDGRLIRVAVHATPWFSGDQFVGVQGRIRELSVLDLIAGKQAERDLLSAYAELEQMFNVAAPICLLSLECRLLTANRAFCVFFGCRLEDVLGKTGQDLWGCQACDTEACPLRQMVGGITPAYLEIDTVVHGRSLVCTLHAVGYVDAAGRPGGMVITFFDGQERKKIAQALLHAQQQLIQAEKLSAIGSLAASIAHEFNNPLCGVRSVVARMARRSGLDTADQSLLTLALEECDRMTRLIKGLQQFNRPFTDSREAFDLHRAMDSVLLLLNKYLKSRKALVHQAYASGPMRIVGAENQIKQVLLNLLRNCSEALPETGGTIRVATCRDHGNVRVVVSDNGVGISAEHLPHLFEPFFTTKSAVKEVGLGLSVSYGIIKGHGGDILVASTPGKGTTFTVVLPVGEHAVHEH